jgi:arylsulfatase/uncharacterized sulfatase
MSAALARALALAAALAPALAPADAQAQQARRPNLVLLVADDIGFSDLGAFGGEIATPHLDALAQAGMRFANFHAAGSCSPTRAMLLTGVEHHRAGIGNLLESMPREHRGRPGYRGSLEPDVVTVASLLQEAGYRTYVAGKWNVGSEPHNLPDRRGFDRSIVQGDTGSDNWVPSQRYLPLGPRVDWFENGRPASMPAEFYSSEWFVDRMIEFLRDDHSGRPFFAVVGFQANHVPLQAPDEYIDRYAGRYEDGWAALRATRRDRVAALGLVPPGVPMVTLPTSPDWDALSPRDRRYQARLMQVYAAMAEAMDHHVGRLVTHLKATGRHDDTVYLFLSDNGPEGSDYRQAQAWLMTQYSQAYDRLGGPGGYAIMGPGWASASASPLSGYKFFGGEGGIRVPLIVAGATGTPPGAIHHGLTHVLDLAPTLLELAGVAHPGTRWQGQAVQPLAGRSLLPVLRDPAGRVRGPDETLGYELSGNKALFRGDLKLVLSLPPVGDGRWHLYDLSADPGETRDLRDAMPEVFAAMQAQYDAWAQAHGVLPMPEGYEPTRQVAINSLLNYWLPTYRVHGVVALTALTVALVALLRRRRAARARRGLV